MTVTPPILEVRGLIKRYARGLIRRRETFRLEAELTVADSTVVGVMGPNGSGKTTLFELITGSNMPSAGSVFVMGRNIHDVKYGERDRLAIHYHQSYQVRHFRRTKPSFLMQPAGHDYPMVHLFDEPQFNTQDGYIGFMLDFFRKLRREGTARLRLPAPQRALSSGADGGGLRALRLRPRRARAGVPEFRLDAPGARCSELSGPAGAAGRGVSATEQRRPHSTLNMQ